MSALKDANLAVKFILELAAIAAFALWGSSLDGALISVAAGIAAPASVVVLWGLFSWHASINGSNSPALPTASCETHRRAAVTCFGFAACTLVGEWSLSDQ